MAEVCFDRFQGKPERLLADPQSNGDIQITRTEESILTDKMTMIIVESGALPERTATMFTSIVRRY